MSQYTTPIETAFEMQRTAIEQGERAMTDALEAQKSANRMALSGIESQATLQRQGVELARASATGWLDAMETATPAGASVRPLRENADETFDRLLDAHEDLFEAFERETERAIEGHDDRSAAVLDAQEAGLQDLLDAHGEVQERTVEAVEETEGHAEEFEGRFESQLEDQLERTAAIQERFEERMDAQLDAAAEFQERLQSRAEAFEIDIDEESPA